MISNSFQFQLVVSLGTYTSNIDFQGSRCILTSLTSSGFCNVLDSSSTTIVLLVSIPFEVSELYGVVSTIDSSTPSKIGGILH